MVWSDIIAEVEIKEIVGVIFIKITEEVPLGLQL